MRPLRRFGRFWYDFLVGDRWELFVGPIVALALVAAAATAGAQGVLAGLLLFGLVAVIGGASVAAQARAPRG